MFVFVCLFIFGFMSYVVFVLCHDDIDLGGGMNRHFVYTNPFRNQNYSLSSIWLYES